jgi:hypothetical protein
MLARKQRAKWWSRYIPLAYVTVIGLFVLIYLGVAFVDRRLPRWLTAIGISPSGVDLLLGTLWCAVGVWGIRTQRGEAPFLFLNALCLIGGILLLARALSFI